jgi:glycosyltransferase involved in cell wall biosynthesis
MSKKILIISQLFYPDTFGGSEKVLYYQAKELIKNGFEVTVLVRKNKAGLANQGVIEGIKVIRYENILDKIWGKSLSDIFFLPGIVKKVCQKENFDLVIFHHDYATYGFLKAKINLPSIYVFHASYAKELLVEGLDGKIGINFIDNSLKNILAKFLLKTEIEALNKCNQVIVLSQFSKSIIKDLVPDILDEKISIIPGGVNLDFFKPGDKSTSRQKLNLATNRPTLLTVRRLVGRMGIENLINACQKLKDDFPNFLLLIGGRGALANKFEGLVKDLNLTENIKFLDFIKEEELPLYYQSADAFILPTLAYEGFGLITLEALACGTPVLGTPVGATPEILSQINKSYIFKDKDSEAIYNGIKDFLNSKEWQDNKDLAMKLRAFVEHNYSWEKAGNALISQINKLI